MGDNTAVKHFPDDYDEVMFLETIDEITTAKLRVFSEGWLKKVVAITDQHKSLLEVLDNLDARTKLLELVVANAPLGGINTPGPQVRYEKDGKPITSEDEALLRQFVPGIFPSPAPSSAPADPQPRTVDPATGRSLMSDGRISFFRVPLPDGLGVFAVDIDQGGVVRRVIHTGPAGTTDFYPKGHSQ